jgi:flagellar protein FlaJ
MPRVEKKIAYIMYAGCGIIACIIAFMALRYAIGTPDFAFMLSDAILAALIIMLTPVAVVDYLNRRWITGIEDNLANLLRDLAESQRTGMTFERALEATAEREYGPLTPEMKRVATQLSWGVPYEKALESFAKRVETPLTYRVVTLISETARSGGNIERVMNSIVSHVRDLRSIERERRAQMRPYIFITYITVFVFLFTLVMLFKMFFSTLSQMTAQGSMFLAGAVTPTDYKLVFFHMTIVEAFLGGLIGGKMSAGSIVPGVKHSVILMIITLLVFNILV